MDLKQAYRALDPARPLDVDSSYYVARPDNPVAQIITELQLTDLPRRYLLTGHRGTGKTTELRRIQTALANKVKVVESQVTEATAPDVNRWLNVVLAHGFGYKLENQLGRMEWINWAISKASDAAGSPIALTIDGLDKFDDAEAMSFLDALFRLDAPINIVSTVPVTLPMSEKFGELAQRIDAWHFLPCIDLWTRDGQAHTPGWDQCREIITKRAPVFTEQALPVLIKNGAGIHRELLRLAQKACVFAATQTKTEVDENDAERAVHDVRNEYSIMLRSDDIPLLHEIEQTGRLSSHPELERLLRDQFIVGYGEGGTWFAVHPIVRPLIKKQAV